MADDFVKVAQIEDLPPGATKSVEIGGELVALINADGDICAIGGECTHAAAYLADGYLDGDMLECPLHGACFDIKTGRAMTPPAFEDVPTYEVKVEGGDILLGPEKQV